MSLVFYILKVLIINHSINKLLPDNPATEIIKQHDSTYAQAKLRHKYYSRKLNNQQNI